MNNLAYAIAKTILNGFERHIFLFTEITRSAKDRFEKCQWHDVHLASKQRTDFYDKRVNETLTTVKQDFEVNELDCQLWQQVKQSYVELLKNHQQTDLAESFYNSIFCHIFERKYYNNNYIFVETTATDKKIASEQDLYTRYHPKEKGLKQTICDILQMPKFALPYENLSRDVDILIQRFYQQSAKTHFNPKQLSFDIIDNVFYRNKGAYIIGRVNSPAGETPFIVALVNNEEGGIVIDAMLSESEEMAIVFGFARAYFFVDCQQPFALVEFLRKLIPHKTKAELYSAVGFHKQGKTQFYRDFLYHLSASDDQLILAPGIKGMVMSVFTLPSYPYVFKIIKDKFSPSKNVTKAQVKEKYRLVKLHDRVGRMADTMEYSEVAFPKARFSQELLDELMTVAPSIIRFEDDLVVIKHMYIERRMTPLNLFLAQATEEEQEDALFGYGQAIKQLIAADIFPGDMLLKNFGVTRHGRVIFYDYDEITYMNEVSFRTKPEPKTEEQIYASEPWYTVNPGDVFPEELAVFALANPTYRRLFTKHHEDLLSAPYWQNAQKNVADGVIENVYPYPNSVRFCHHSNQEKAQNE